MDFDDIEIDDLLIDDFFLATNAIAKSEEQSKKD